MTASRESRPGSWRRIIERLGHPDMWGPGGLYPLEAFRRSGRGWVARCPSGDPSGPAPVVLDAGGPRLRPLLRLRVPADLDRVRAGAAGPLRRRRRARRFARPSPCWPSARGSLAMPSRGDASSHRNCGPRGGAQQACCPTHPRAVACRAYLVARGVPEAVLPRLPVGAWTDARTIRAGLRAARLSPDSCESTGSWPGTCRRIRSSSCYEDAEGVTGFKCRKPSLRGEVHPERARVRRRRRGPEPLRA